MRIARVCQHAMQAALVCGAMAARATDAIPPTESTQWSFEAGIGHESQSSPLFQISQQSTVIYIDGLQRLKGAHARASVQGSSNWTLAHGVGLSLNASALVKRSRETPDFDFSSASLQPGLHVPIPGASLGVGLNLQTMDVAGRHFRHSQGIQFSWTRAQPSGLWAVMADVTEQRHAPALADLDATSSTVVLQRHWNNPSALISGVDLSAIVGREKNRRGIAELSNSSVMFHAAMQWQWLGAKWSLGQAFRRAHFDGVAFEGEVPRQDQTRMLDIGVELPVGPEQTLRLEFNDVRNVSSTRLYANHYQQWLMALRTSW